MTNRSTMERSHKLLSIIAAAVGLVTVVAAWSADESIVYNLTDENGIVESLSAFFYFLGIVTSLSYLISGKSRFKAVLIFWVFLCFIFLGEETSWFQSILHYETPSWMLSANKQHEFNIHNLSPFQGGKWVDNGEVGTFNIKMLFSSQNIYRLFYFTYFLLIPLLTRAGKMEFVRKRVSYPEPDFYFLAAIWITVLVSFGLSVASTHVIKSGLAEIREMYYAAFIFFYLLLYGK